MDCSRLHLSIPYVTISPHEGTVHKYCIKVVYGKLEWKLYRRFSEFHSLNDALCGVQKFDALPLPPPKLFLRPHDQETLEERRIMLETWMGCLARRPDIRTSSSFVDFIEFEANTNTTVEPLAPCLVAVWDEGRYRLSDVAYSPETSCLVASFEESASMARVGKVWSLVEVEELGCLSIFELRGIPPPSYPKTSFFSPSLHQPNTSKQETFGILFDKLAHMAGPHRFHKIHFSRPNNRFFVALHTGVVQVYKGPYLDSTVGPHSTQSFHGFEKEEELTLHSECILSLYGDNGFPGRFVTAGYDHVIRVVNCQTLEIMAGGNIAKRFEYKERITLAILESIPTGQDLRRSRLCIGTTKGNVLIFSLYTNPPTYRTTIACQGRIGAMELAGHNLLVAHKSVLTIYRIGEFGKECDYSVTCQLNPNLSSGSTISCIAISISIPLLFLGHVTSITVWDCHEKACVAAFKAHNNTIQCLRYIGNVASLFSTSDPQLDSDGFLLLSGGSDSSLKLWMFRNVQQYLTATPGGGSSTRTNGDCHQDSNKEKTMQLNHCTQDFNPKQVSPQTNLPLNHQNISQNTFNTSLSSTVIQDDRESDEDQSSLLSPSFRDSVPHRH